MSPSLFANRNGIFDPIPSLAEKILDEVDGQHELGRAFNAVIATHLKALADRVTAEGIETAEEFLLRYPDGVL